MFRLLAVSLLLLLAVGECKALRFQLQEESPGGSPVGTVSLPDRISPNVAAGLKFRILTATDHFAINSDSGELSVTRPIDREAVCPRNPPECLIDLRVNAHNEASGTFELVKVEIDLTDINDNPPKFPTEELTAQISEAALPGQILSIPLAADPDLGQNGAVRYSIQTNGGPFPFRLQHEDDASVILTESIDRETQARFRAIMVARDEGSPPNEVRIPLTITVLDVNDNRPVFPKSEYRVTVPENRAVDSLILDLNATDSDSGPNGQLTYGFDRKVSTEVKRVFRIEPNTGRIVLSERLDYEQLQTMSYQYDFYVVVSDSGQVPATATATVFISVTDVNDHEPTISVTGRTTDTGSFQVSEYAAEGTYLAYVTVSDPDTGAGGRVTCRMISDDFTMTEAPEFPNEFTVKTARTFDREEQAFYTVAIECQDAGSPSLSSTETLHVKIADENDQSPIFGVDHFQKTMLETNQIGAFVLHVNATDADEPGTPNSEIHFRLDQEGRKNFTIEERTGIIRTRTPLDREHHASTSFVVTAVDGGQISRTATARVTVNIEDANDVYPYFVYPDSSNMYEFHIRENQGGTKRVGVVRAADDDVSKATNGHVAIELSREDQLAGLFQLDPDGQIMTTETFDREEIAIHEIKVIARDRGLPPLESTETVRIRIDDENDNAPVVEFPNWVNNTVYIPFNHDVGTEVTTVKAHDADVGLNGQLLFGFFDGTNSDGFFHIDPLSGIVTLAKQLSYHQRGRFELGIEVSDSSPPFHKLPIVTLIVTVTEPPDVDLFVSNQEDVYSRNLIIMIALLGASGLVSILIIIAIVVLILRRGRKNTDNVYNARMEAERKFPEGMRRDSLDTMTGLQLNIANGASPTAADANTMELGSSSGSPASGSQTTGESTLTKSASPPGVSYVPASMSMTDETLPSAIYSQRTPYHYPAYITNRPIQRPIYTPPAQVPVAKVFPSNSETGGTRPPTSTRPTHPAVNSEKAAEYQKLLTQLRNGNDSDSVQSNCDSGRGASDEELHRRQQQALGEPAVMNTFQPHAPKNNTTTTYVRNPDDCVDDVISTAPQSASAVQQMPQQTQSNSRPMQNPAKRYREQADIIV